MKISGVWFLATALVLCVSAGATTFECGVLTDNSGVQIPDRTQYFVATPATTTGMLPDSLTLIFSGKQILMTNSSNSSSSEGAVYASRDTDVQLYYSIAPAMPGLPSFVIGIHKTFNGDEYRSTCPGNPLRVSGAPRIGGNTGMCYSDPSCESPIGEMNETSCSSVGRSWSDDSDGSCTNF